MAHKRYTDGYMMYHCSECDKWVQVYLEESLEKRTENSKPVPFVILCPFCGKPDCRDEDFHRFPMPRQKLTKHMFAFWDVEGDSCGKPMNKEAAVPLVKRKEVYCG